MSLWSWSRISFCISRCIRRRCIPQQHAHTNRQSRGAREGGAPALNVLRVSCFDPFNPAPQIKPLDDDDIELLKTYGVGPYR
jgi:hypothetical protein